MGPNDRLLTSTLAMARVPVFDKLWSQTNVCVWDVAAAHLLHEDALRRIPEESAGQAFLVTGKSPAWRLQDTRNVVKVGVFQTTPFVCLGLIGCLYCTVLLNPSSHLHGRSATTHIYPCSSRRALLSHPLLYAPTVLHPS